MLKLSIVKQMLQTSFSFFILGMCIVIAVELCKSVQDKTLVDLLNTVYRFCVY